MGNQLPKNSKATPGSRRWRSKTLIAAYFILGLVIWQAVHIYGGGELPFGRSETSPMGSTKFLTNRDAQARKIRPSKEPVEAFFDRAKRGMTDQEVRGMIADFEAIGPMPTSGKIDESRVYAEKLDDWYYGALAEALLLSNEQKQALRVSLAEKLNQRMEHFKSGFVEQSNGMTIIINFEAAHYLRNITQAPWEHCDLTEDQSMLTNKRSWQKRNDTAKNNPYPFNQVQPWLNYNSIAMHDVVTGETVGYPPPSVHDLACTLHGTLSGGVLDISDAFPLTPDQKIADHRRNLAAQVKMLHPAQLRMALLLNPHLARTIKHELDKPKE